MKLLTFMRGNYPKINLSFCFTIFFSIVLFSSSISTNNKLCFWCLHLSPGLHPSLSADTVYTLNKVKTAVTEQSGFFDKNFKVWLLPDQSCAQNYFGWK